jgi:hypothetical protein
MEEMIKLCFIIGMICLLLWGGFLALTTGANMMKNLNEKMRQSLIYK